MLAGVSADYYTRLEKGNLTGVSDSVLEAIAGALQLNEAERLHLFDLARTANTSPARAARRRPPPAGPPRHPADPRRHDRHAQPSSATAAWTSSPSTPSAAPCTHPSSPVPAAPANLARFQFLDPAAREFYPSFEDSARTTVELLRTEAGRDPFNPVPHRPDRRTVHPQRRVPRPVGRPQRPPAPHQASSTSATRPSAILDLMFEAMALEADEGLTLTAYTAQPGTPSHDGLKLLASWAATRQREDDAQGSKSDRTQA